MPTIDPAAIKFVEEIAKGASSIPDSIAGILLRLLGRVSSLETTSKQHALKLDKLAKQPRWPGSLPEPTLQKTLTGIDAATGAPVRIEPKRPVGRPPGSRDSAKRRPRGAELFHKEDLQLLDTGFDDL
jgi:hypothetical protein